MDNIDQAWFDSIINVDVNRYEEVEMMETSIINVSSNSSSEQGVNFTPHDHPLMANTPPAHFSIASVFIACLMSRILARELSILKIG